MTAGGSGAAAEGMFGRLGKWWAAACAYEFLESALACRCGARAERDAAPLRVSRSASDSTNSSAFFLLASLRPPNLLDRKFGGELSVNAKGGKICVWGRLVWAGTNDHDPSQMEADFEPETSAIGVLRALKCAW